MKPNFSVELATLRQNILQSNEEMAKLVDSSNPKFIFHLENNLNTKASQQQNIIQEQAAQITCLGDKIKRHMQEISEIEQRLAAALGIGVFFI